MCVLVLLNHTKYSVQSDILQEIINIHRRFVTQSLILII